MSKPLLNAGQVSDIVGVSRPQVYRLADPSLTPKAIPSYRIGSSLRFRETDVLEWLESCRVKPPSEPEPPSTWVVLPPPGQPRRPKSPAKRGRNAS